MYRMWSCEKYYRSPEATLSITDLLVKRPIIIGNLFWKLTKKKFDRNVE